jgi:hypothetical protein
MSAHMLDVWTVIVYATWIASATALAGNVAMAVRRARCLPSKDRRLRSRVS